MVVVGDLEVLLFCRISCKLLDDLLAVCAEVLLGDLYPDLLALDRLFQVSNKVFKLFALHAELSKLDDYSCDKVSTVIKEVVFLHSCMAGCFNSKRAAYLVLVLSDSFINNILVAPLESEVLAFELLLDELIETC